MKLKEVYALAKSQGKEDICRFMRDMKRAKVKMRYYEGRYFWKGPAASCDYASDVLSHTKVKCQWDSLGRGHIVYPRQSL